MTQIWVYRYTPIIPALRRQRQVNLCKIDASVLYIGVPGQGE